MLFGFHRKIPTENYEIGQTVQGHDLTGEATVFELKSLHSLNPCREAGEF